MQNLVDDNQFIPIPDCIEQQSQADLWNVFYHAYPDYLKSIASDGYSLSLVEVLSSFLDHASALVNMISTIVKYMIDVGFLTSEKLSICQLLASEDYQNWSKTKQTDANSIIHKLFGDQELDKILSSYDYFEDG